jgi:ribosomal protein L13E
MPGERITTLPIIHTVSRTVRRPVARQWSIGRWFSLATCHSVSLRGALRR